MRKQTRKNQIEEAVNENNMRKKRYNENEEQMRENKVEIEKNNVGTGKQCKKKICE